MLFFQMHSVVADDHPAEEQLKNASKQYEVLTRNDSPPISQTCL